MIGHSAGGFRRAAAAAGEGYHEALDSFPICYDNLAKVPVVSGRVRWLLRAELLGLYKNLNGKTGKKQIIFG